MIQSAFDFPFHSLSLESFVVLNLTPSILSFQLYVMPARYYLDHVLLIFDNWHEQVTNKLQTSEEISKAILWF